MTSPTLLPREPSGEAVAAEPRDRSQPPAPASGVTPKSSDAVRSVSEHEFISTLVDQVRAGYRLVPFLGSGCSAHSGILMGQQFSDYLAWTVALCVADAAVQRELLAEERSPSRLGKRWDLRRNGWPRAPRYEESEVVRRWARKEFDCLATACKLAVKPDNESRVVAVEDTSPANGDPDALTRMLYAPLVPPVLRDPRSGSDALTDGQSQRRLHRLLTEEGLLHGGLLRAGISPSSEDAITERAVRSLYDWRSTLRFLSELKLGRDGATLFLDRPDPSVIDNFNVHITRGKQPNLTHAMLCHLRQPARARLILTTNFDTLIEDAFARERRRIEVISVSVRGALPDPEIVHARDTVVKLHGTFSETRADFSLDEHPTLEDRERFFHYVRGAYPDDGRPGFVPGHLLVAGYSGSDARCVQLMKSVLEGDPEALIFWICNTEWDRERVVRIFPERSYGQRVITTTTERADLLLYEFHQRLCLTLPAGSSARFHINHNVAPDECSPSEQESEDRAAAIASIEKAAPWLSATDEQGQRRDPAPARKILVVDGPSGVLGAMRGALEQLTRAGLNKVWMELEDYADTASLAQDLFQIIASRRGVLHLGHMELCPRRLCEPFTRSDGLKSDQGTELARRWTDHIRLLQDHLQIEPTQWIIALYGRNGPGGCAGWEENELFWKKAEYGDGEHLGPFTAFLLGLRDAGFTVIYAPYSPMRLRRDEERRRELEGLLLQSANGWGLTADVVQQIVKDSYKLPCTTHDEQDLNEAFKRFYRPGRLAASQAEAGGLDVDRLPPWSWLDLSHVLKGSRIPFAETACSLLEGALRLDSDWPPSSVEPDAGAADDARRGDGARSRYTLLYGASLFRQSRHYSSFSSEGVLQCPRRFNVEGDDNDLMRHARIERLLSGAKPELRLFLRKPGGFAWLYRDTRMALRCLAEAASLGSDKAGRTLETGVQSVRAFRARSHSLIGAWYLRAFYASGHANPLMEAAYHFYQSLLHAPDAQAPKHKGRATLSDVEHKMAIWRRSLQQLVKTLRCADTPLKLWFGNGQLRSWFQANDAESNVSCPDRLIAEIRTAWDELAKGPLNSTDAQTLRLLRAELEQLRNLSAVRPRAHSLFNLQGVTLTAEQLGKCASTAGASSNEPDRLQTEREYRPNMPDFAALKLDVCDPKWWEAAFTSEGQPAGDPEQQQKKKKNGLRLRRVLESLDGYFGGDADGEAKGCGRWEAELAELRDDCHDEPALAMAIFQELAEWTYVLLCRAKRLEYGVLLQEAQVAAGTRGAVASVSWEKRRLLTPLVVRQAWVKVCLCANAVVDAATWLPAGFDAFANFEVSKTLSLYAVALARLGRFFEAHRRLNHAEAILMHTAQSELLVPIGLVELRRGEAYLLEALMLRDTMRVLCDPSAESLESLKACVVSAREKLTGAFDTQISDGKQRSAAVWRWFEPQFQAMVKPLFERGQPTPTLLRRGLTRIVVARADDAWSSLERAESLLAGRSHSPLWWSRLRALQLLTLSTSPSRSQRDEAPYRPLATRVRADDATLLRTMWREGIAAAPEDWFNRLRLLDFYVRALRAFGVGDQAAAQRELNECRQHLRLNGEDAPRWLSLAHADNVQWRIDALCVATVEPRA